MATDGITKNNLVMWAKEYNSPLFIDDDPVQFPRKYINSQVDAEVSGLLTALISFGNRKQIIKKAQELDDMFKGKPKRWILNLNFVLSIPLDDKSFYRTISNRQMRIYCDKLYGILTMYDSIYSYLKYIKANDFYFKNKSYLDILKNSFGFSENSSAKRLAMYLRWMVRNDGIVDLGLWHGISSKGLIIPLDTHVHKMALELGITKRKTTDIKTAMEITDYFKTIWPFDPCLGDFALFGYGVNNR